MATFQELMAYQQSGQNAPDGGGGDSMPQMRALAEERRRLAIAELERRARLRQATAAQAAGGSEPTGQLIERNSAAIDRAQGGAVAPEDARRLALMALAEKTRRQRDRGTGQRTFEITAPDGQTFRVQGTDPQSAFTDWQASQQEQPTMPQEGMAQLSDMSSRPIVGGRDARGIPNENQWAGGVLPNPQQAVRNMRDNLFGDDDPTTLNRGEMTAAALNKAGEAMTMGLVGDEAAGAFDAATGRGDYAERRDFYRAQERQLEEQAPGVALGAEVAGALIGPGKGAGAFVNRGVGTAARIGRGAAVGAGSGAVYGAAEGEGGEGRAFEGAKGALAGAVGGAGFTALGQGFNRVAQRLSRDPAARAVVPTLEGLKAEAQGLYAAAEASGAKLPQGRMVSLRNSTNNVLKSAGYNPRLHPRLSVVLDELDDLAKGPQGLQQVEQLRRIAGNASQSMQPDERRLGALVIDRIDETIEGMGEGSKPLQQAREVWGRMRRMESVEALIEDASNSPNFEQALATKFRAMLRNTRKMRGFSSVERQAMARIASGKSVAGALQGLGKIMSPTGLMGAVTSGGAIMGAGPAGVLVPMAGIAARTAGNAGVRKQAQNVLNTVGRTDAQRAAADSMLRQGNALAPLSGMTPQANEALSQLLRQRLLEQ